MAPRFPGRGRRPRDPDGEHRPVDVTNVGDRTWPGLTTAEYGRVDLYARWKDIATGREIEQPFRTPLARDLAPGETVRAWVELQNPPPGNDLLEIGVAQASPDGFLQTPGGPSVFGTTVQSIAPLCGGHRPPPPSTRAHDERPNVLFVVVDSLRADRLAAYGYPWGKTAALDDLAATGVVFERAIAAATSTVPSHASLFTGLYPRQHSIGTSRDVMMLTNETTLAERLYCAGYATGSFVGNAKLDQFTGLDRGFDEWDDELPRRTRALGKRNAANTTRRAVEWLAQTGDRPTFLFVHYEEPAGPYTAPDHLQRAISLPTPQNEPALPIHDDDSGLGGIPRSKTTPVRPSTLQAADRP